MPGIGQHEHLHIPDQVVDTFLDTVGNHEVKLALSGLYLILPRYHFTTPSFLTHVREHVEDDFQLLRHKDIMSLSTRNLVGDESIVIDEVEGLRANPRYRMKHLALTGFLASWSLDWPDLSLQQVYGDSRRRSSRGPGAPAERQALYETVHEYENIGESLSTIDLSRISGVEYGAATRHIRRLTQLDILRKDSVRDMDYDIEIRSDTYDNLTCPLEACTPETQAFYAAISRLGLGPTSLDRVISAAKAAMPEIDSSRLRAHTRQKLLAGTAPRNIRLITERETGQRKMTSIQFGPETRRHMQLLAEGIAAIRRGENIPIHAQRCREIVDDKRTLTALFAKGMNFSDSRRKHNRDTVKNQVLAAIAEHQDGVDVEGALAVLRRLDSTTSWSESYLRAMMDKLVDDGRLSRRDRPKHEHSKKMIAVYRVTGEDSDGGAAKK